MKLNEIADRYEHDLETGALQLLAGSTDKENIVIVTAELERKRSQAQKLRAIKAEGRIVLELQDGDAQVKNLPDLASQDGDSVFIPRKPGTVDVMGAVFQQMRSSAGRAAPSANTSLWLAGKPSSPTSRKCM